MAIGTPTSLGTFTRGQIGAVGSFSFTTSAAVNAGDLVLVGVGFNGAGTPQTVSSVTDSAGNTYSKAKSAANGTDDTELWYCANAVAMASGGTITITFTGTYGSSGYGAASAAAVSGISSTPLDATASQTTTGTSPSVSSGALAQSSELVVGLSYNDDSNPTFTEGANFTNINTTGSAAGSKLAMSHRIVNSTSSETWAPTWGTSGSLTTLLATFKAPIAADSFDISSNCVFCLP